MDTIPTGRIRSRLPARIAAMLGAAGATALFLLPWWNRYAGLTLDGYFPLYGHLILQGQVPYRDFFLHLPPLQPLAEAALEAVAGRSLFAVRLAGALGRILIAALLAGWLSRRHRAWVAVLATLAAVWLASGDDTEILDLYNHHALLAAIVAGWAASAGFDRGPREGRAWLLSGAAAAAAIWTKQTIGVGATAAIVAVLALAAVRDPEERRRLPARLARFAAGWALPGLVICGWLWREGALGSFLQQVFVDASASKGSLATLLARPVVEPFTSELLRAPALAGLLLAVLTWWLPGPQRSADSPPLGERGGRLRAALLVGISLAGAGLVLELGRALAIPDVDRVHDLRWIQRAGVFCALFGVLGGGAAWLARVLRRPLDGAERERLAQVAVAAGTAATLAFSWPGGEAIALPALAVVLAGVGAAAPRRWPGRALRVALLAAACGLAAATFALRLISPFSFAFWREPPVARATVRPRDPTLAGMRLSPSTAETLDAGLALLRESTRPGEPIFTFPALPIFHWLADRPLATFAALHWIDVTPDRITRADLERLLAAPPAAIVRQRIPAARLRAQEEYFRGEPGSSGLAEMAEALDRLLADDYRLAASFEQVDRWRPRLEVWVREGR